jgi:uncharacterized protein YigE (DUF2233 family)
MTLRLLPLLPALLPSPRRPAGNALTDPSLTLQSYTVNPQRERIAMYWKNADGEAFGSLRALLADIDRDGRVQMAMNGGIYAKTTRRWGCISTRACRRLRLTALPAAATFLSVPAGCFICRAKAKIVSIDKFKPSSTIAYAVQSGPMLIENGTINWRLKPSASSRKLRNGVGITRQGQVIFMLSDRETNFYDFACYAQSTLNVRQMLYLDGTISKMYRKGGSVPWQYHPFVTMIAESKSSP